MRRNWVHSFPSTCICKQRVRYRWEQRTRKKKRYADHSVDCQRKRWAQRTSCLPFFFTERSKFYTERNQENVTSQIKFRERWVLFPVRSKLRMQSSLPSTDSLPALFPLSTSSSKWSCVEREKVLAGGSTSNSSTAWRRLNWTVCLSWVCLSWFSKSRRRNINAHVTQSSL